MIYEHLASVKRHIQDICNRTRRNNDVVLIAVSKYATAEQTREAIEAGVSHLGENRVQEAAAKFEALGELADKVTKHMIGHLQTNKVSKALELFDIIQSVDSKKLAVAIDKQAEKLGRPAEVLIQVNVSNEAQKSGIAVSELDALLDAVKDLKYLKVTGLMAMAPNTEDRGVIRQCFRQLRQLSEQMGQRFGNSANINLKYLSMGMTADYEIAIEEGANMVRIGSAIFNS